MKSKCSFILKASTALVLALLMLFGTVTTSIAAVVDNAETGKNADLAETGDDNKIIFVELSASWAVSGNILLHYWGGTTSGDASLSSYSGAIYKASIPSDSTGMKLHWNNGDWYGSDGDAANQNYAKLKQDNVVDYSTYQVTSTASLAATKTSMTTAESSTLTPSLSSNATYNDIKSTTYTVTTNPGSAGSVTSAGVFTAKAAGTYTVKATVTYNAKGFTGITKTAEATKQITVSAASNPAASSVSISRTPSSGTIYAGVTSVKYTATATSAVSGATYNFKVDGVSKQNTTSTTYTTTFDSAGTKSVTVSVEKSGYDTVTSSANSTTVTALPSVILDVYPDGNNTSIAGTMAYNAAASTTIGSNHLVYLKSVSLTKNNNYYVRIWDGSSNYKPSNAITTDKPLSGSGESGSKVTDNSSTKVTAWATGSYDFYYDNDSHKFYVQGPHEVTFNMKSHGTAPTTQTIAYGGKVTKPTDPTATGWTFVGWYKETGCTNAWNFSTDTVTATTTLYAKWTQNAHSVTYPSTTTGYDLGGTKPTSACYGDTVSFTVTPKSGYRISAVKYTPVGGSATNCTAGSGNTYSFTMPDKDVSVTVTAVKTYTVTLSASGTGMGSTKQYFVGTTPDTYSDYSSAVTVDAGSTVYFKVSYATGYEYNSVTNATVYTANTVFKTGAINANTTVTITASEKAKKTITVTNTSSGGTGTINVSGNSVSGAATSFAAGTSTFQAHVDDVLTFSATPGSQSKLSSEGIKINGTAATTLTVTDAATVTATFVNNPSTVIYVPQIDSSKDTLYVWTVKADGKDDGSVHPLGDYPGKKLNGNYTTLKINNKTYYKVEIPETSFSSKSYFGAIYNGGQGDAQSDDLKPFAVGGTYKLDVTESQYSTAAMAAWTDSNYAVNLTETGGTLNTTHTAAATFQSNSTTSGTTIGTNPANYAGSTITVTAHPKTGYWAFVTATYGGSATTGLAETGSGLVSNIIKKIELAATGAGETAVTVTGNPIKTDGGTATFTMPAGATDITVNYTAIPTYTMKLSAGAHGTIALKSGSTTLKTAAAGTTENVTVTAGTSYSVVVTPDSGYLVKTLSEAGTNVSAAAGKTSAYTHSWTAPDEQPGNTYLTGTFAKNDPEIGTLLYNGYNTSGSSVTGYVDKAFKTSTYNGETFAYYKVSGRGTGDHLFTVKNNAEETATGSAIYFTRPNHSYWNSSGVKAHFYTDGAGTVGNEFYEMDFSYTDDYGNAVYRLNLDSYPSLKSALTADTKVTFHNSASVATATGWGLMTWAGCFYCPNASDNNNFSLAGWPSGQKSDAFNITTGRTYNGDDNGSGKAYQHNNDGFYGSDMSLNNHNTNGYNYEKTNSSSTSDYYILYFYPNTNYGTINNKSANNTNDYPIIVASTTLPNNEDDGKITVYAKYGTVDTGRSPTAEFGSTTVETNADVEVASTNTTDGYVVAKATPGKSITLTTTVNAANASKYYVKGWDINGTTYGLNPEATGNSYTLTYNIPEDAETLEITPIYWMKDSSKMTRFYVRSFNEAPAAWGDALYCYFYNSSTADIGYPGQPCVHEGALYYTEIPTDSQGITLNNAVWDTIHGEMMMGLSGTTAKQNAHYQTYDYDNFQKIVKEKSDGLKSIYFTFEFRDKKDNLGSTSGSSSSISLSDYNDTNGNGWEDLKDLKGNFINIFDEELGSGQGQTSLDTNKTLYVISNGYACNYEGEFATEWAVYVSTDGTNATYVTTIPSSALLINSAARLSESVYPNSNTAKYTPLLSSYTSAYNTLKNTYSHYKVKITYEKVLKYGDSVLHGNNIETNDIANRIDGKWDYTKNTDYVVADVKIQYRNTPDGAYTDDTFGGTGNYTGTTTQATAYFTNEEPVVSGSTSIYQKTSCPTGTYYVSNDVYFTFLTTPKASAGYQFDGWYMKTDASDEAVLIDTSTSAKSLMDSNATFIARYTKVSSGSLTITHSSSGSGSANRIALKAEVIDPNDPANAIETYSGTDYVTIPTAYIKNTSSYQVKVTLYSVANPATSYIDMVTNPTAITSEKDGGSVNVFNSPTYTYDRRAASKYNQNVTTVIGAFNISALFSGTTQNTMLINYTTRIDKLPTYTINYRYHGRGQTGDAYMTFTRTISLTPDEAEGKNADGTPYSGNNGQALTATYITSSSDNLVNDITANAPNQNDLQTEVFNKEIEWEAPASIEPNSTTVTAVENDPKYTLTYWYVDVNDGIKKFKTVEAEYNKLITLGEKIGETTTYATAETYDGKKFAYWALGTEYGDPLTSTREYKMRLVNDVTIYPVYGNPANGWNSAIDKITRTHQTSDTSDSIFTDFALRFSGFDENGSFIHINPDYKDKYTVGVAVVYDTEGNNTTETTEQLPDGSGVFYDLSKTTKYKTAQEMIQLLVTGNKTTARLKEISDTTYVSKYDADNNKLTNFNRIDYALKYNYNTYYKRSYDAYAYIVDKDTNTVLAVSPVKSGYLYDGKLPSGAGN